jgi:phospholipid/cholesterol/gamma-HCH transport system substrate-binding protein
MKLSKEFKVGLFMVISIALLYFGFNFLKGIDFFSTSKKYYVIYKNVDKLTESNLVYLNGYGVGRVSNIEIQQSKNRVVVELDIESDIIITDSSTAELNGELLGGRFVLLNVTPKGKPLEPKDTIRAVVAKGMLDFAQPVALTLQETLNHLNELLGGLSKNMGRIDTLFIGLKQTPGILNKTLATANSNIGTLGGEFKVVAGNINSTLAELKPTLANFKTLSDSLKMMELNGTLNKAQVSLSKLNETLSRLNKGDNTMSKLMTEDSLYVNLNKLLVTIDSLASHFNNNPKHFMSPLGKSRKKIERDLKEQAEKKK